ncbi:MAG: dihydrofolate reductase [Actinophytocola sp.]|uniref:dihydrofolate reductase family protein n=1 Tax=Actinophytocola sp. TaxID=1872138 RepID=UPI001329496E|nr:dihydrofolate reductase family protein [Actinophytocola sp.]MPZ83981.1 dihydrofolate reductase [Actinophytocola sp.]
MSKIVVDTFLTVDGVLQAPGAPDEDREGGFTHGGWQAPLFDEAAGEFVGEGFARIEGLLLGRKTYEIFAAYWPRIADDHPDAAAGQALNALPKYVASRTLTGVEWQNSTLLGDDVTAAVAKLREQQGGEIHVMGSGDLVQTLIRHDLVDEYRLMIFPVVLGTGKKLFAEGAVPTALELVESRTTPGGVVICVYRRAGEVTYGSFGPAE